MASQMLPNPHKPCILYKYTCIKQMAISVKCCRDALGVTHSDAIGVQHCKFTCVTLTRPSHCYYKL